ncbi:MAG TPA: sialidase family protein [Vicinamibacterales bacterium]|nr:sialidase family protein [Vicinamibacterales bacterium]
MRSLRSALAGVVLLVVWPHGTVDNAAGRSAVITLDVPGRADATPWIAASGPFAAVVWGARDGSGTDVFAAVSRDGGSTFGPPVRVNKGPGEARLGGELPPRVALTHARGSAPPEIVVVWTARGEQTAIKVARSRDGGRTFGAPALLQSPRAPGDRGWPSVAVDASGRVHAVWLDHRGLAEHRTASRDHRRHAPHDGVAMAQRSGLYYASLAVASGEATPERELAKGVCYCCKTALAAGQDGALYAAWRHVYPGNLRDMAFTMSADGGRTFSQPVRVSEDAWAIDGCPDDGPAIAVDERGVVHLVWPTVIGDDAPEGAIFYASTRDGVRFTPRVRVPTLGGTRPSHPQIAVDRNGRIFVAWDESIDGERIAVVRELWPRTGGTPEFGPVIRLAEDAASYPVLAATDRGLIAAWTVGGEPSRVQVRAVTGMSRSD